MKYLIAFAATFIMFALFVIAAVWASGEADKATAQTLRENISIIMTAISATCAGISAIGMIVTLIFTLIEVLK